MRSDEQRYKTIGLMIFTAIIIFSVVGIVIIGFKMVKKNEEAKLVAAADTEYMKKQKQDIESQEGSQEEKSTEESLNIEEFLDSATDSDKNTNAAADSDSDTEVSEADARVYLIQGNEKSSNRYEKADHLSYTTVTKYTLQDLSILDSYGLKITRNEIFARHGRMFNDQELQEYFKRQQWYVPQIAANDFDASCLNEVEKYIRSIPDFPEPGIIFRDITTVTQDPKGLKIAIDSMLDKIKDIDFDVIVGLEARGFIFGMPLAYLLGKSFVLVRKKGKLPRECYSEEYSLEYGTSTLEITKEALHKGDRVLLLDDLLATGGTAGAMIKLVRKSGAEIVSFGFIIELFDLGGAKLLEDTYGVNVQSLVKFPGH